MNERKFFTDAEAAAALGMTTAQLMTLVRNGEISYIRRADETVEFEQCDFDKFREREAEKATLAKILARGPSGAKEFALLRKHQAADNARLSDEVESGRGPKTTLFRTRLIPKKKVIL
jgi:hypothetical protein